MGARDGDFPDRGRNPIGVPVVGISPSGSISSAIEIRETLLARGLKMGEGH